MAEQWDDKFDYLNVTRGLYHNQDYWRFLVRDVWRLDTRPSRLIDFGCGFGWVGLFLMPMLAEGSEYTGLDLAAPLLERRALFSTSFPIARIFSGAMTSKDAENELPHEMKNDYRRTARDYHIVQPGLITISFGIVNRKK